MASRTKYFCLLLQFIQTLKLNSSYLLASFPSCTSRAALMDMPDRRLSSGCRFRLLAHRERWHECRPPAGGRDPLCHLRGPGHGQTLRSVQLWWLQGLLQAQCPQKPHVLLQVWARPAPRGTDRKISSLPQPLLPRGAFAWRPPVSHVTINNMPLFLPKATPVACTSARH